jgi:hypothetical protein
LVAIQEGQGAASTSPRAREQKAREARERARANFRAEVVFAFLCLSASLFLFPSLSLSALPRPPPIFLSYSAAESVLQAQASIRQTCQWADKIQRELQQTLLHEHSQCHTERSPSKLPGTGGRHDGAEGAPGQGHSVTLPLAEGESNSLEDDGAESAPAPTSHTPLLLSSKACQQQQQRLGASTPDPLIWARTSWCLPCRCCRARPVELVGNPSP